MYVCVSSNKGNRGMTREQVFPVRVCSKFKDQQRKDEKEEEKKTTMSKNTILILVPFVLRMCI